MNARPSLRRLFALCFAALLLLSLTGCFNRTADSQSVPWGRPADWENTAPGFGGGQ